jgi:xanthine dehydrogenase FAD-binding subunit
MALLMSEMKVITPTSLSDALALMQEHREGARPLAGATDVTVRVKEGHWHVPLWINIRRLPELNQITVVDGQVEIGAAVTYGRMLRSPLLQLHAPLLLQAARDVGAVQIQALGTLGGNLGTASPAGDALPSLYALEAQVRLTSTRGERLVPVEAYCLGPGKTVRQPDELITGVRFAAQAAGERSMWQKLGLRGAQAISLVSLAMRLQLGESLRTVSFARCAFGAVGPTVLRAPKCEQMIVHAGNLDEPMLRGIGQMAWKEVLPISDVRASAEYRQQMAAALLQRGLLQLLPESRGEGGMLDGGSD